MKKVTIRDIASELDVTFSTVARALNDHPGISPATKKLVTETAARLNYRQNKLASSLRSGRSHVIGVIVPNLYVNFFSSVVSEIERVMNDNGYNVLLYQSNESFQHESKGIETFLQSRVDGIIASVSGKTTDFSYYEEIVGRKIPLVFFDRAISELKVPSVTIDDFKGGYIATEHLIRQGYRSIVHLTFDTRVSVFKRRFEGYLAALSDHGIGYRPELVFTGNFSADFGRETVQKLIRSNTGFDAIFSSEDITAMGAIQQLLAEGKRVPEDFGVIGFDNEPFGTLVSPQLSTISQQNSKMGIEAAGIMLKLCRPASQDQITGGSVLQPLLISRESSVRKIETP